MSEAFDRLAMMLAGGHSRRDVLKSLGGLLAGGFLAGLTGKARAEDRDDDKDDKDNEAIEKACKKYCSGSACHKPHGVHGHCIERCKKFLRRHPKGTLCGTCTATTPFTGCPAGVTCCPATKTAAAFCTNTTTDLKNCGACGNACATALPKAVTPGCCPGAKGPTCVDLASDVNNCGKCGNACGAKQTCVKGVCT